jgi:hypothetical protein
LLHSHFQFVNTNKHFTEHRYVMSKIIHTIGGHNMNI